MWYYGPLHKAKAPCKKKKKKKKSTHFNYEKKNKFKRGPEGGEFHLKDGRRDGTYL